jgi:hypothetical protein
MVQLLDSGGGGENDDDGGKKTQLLKLILTCQLQIWMKKLHFTSQT